MRDPQAVRLAEAQQNVQSGNALSAQGHIHQAIVHYERALTLKPDYAVAHYNLGFALAAQGNAEQAVMHYERAVALNPNFPEAHNNLGLVLAAQGNAEQAVMHYERAVALKPNFPEAHNNLGNALAARGHIHLAIIHYERALTLKPDYAEAHYNLGLALAEQGRVEQAVAQYQRALALKPDYTEAHCNLGNVFRTLGRIEQAVAHCERALALRPDDALAHNNLGNALSALGHIHQAIVHYERALSLKPGYAVAHSNLLLDLNYVCGNDPAAVYAAHLDYAKRQEAPLTAWRQPPATDRTVQRRLRVGYVSGDFRDHPVGYFIEPVLSHHSHQDYEVFCYSNYATADDATRRLQAYADHWRQITDVSDEAVARQVREDGIDILVDLSGHTAHNRLPVFARKAAPVQVTWLGYLNTTGLSTMDYRLTDACASPPGMMEKYHTETLVRLPDSQWCYQPPPDYPEVGDLPVLASGGLTFASFHNITKITPNVLSLWAEVLAAVPGSRLIMVGRGVDKKAESWGTYFTQCGVDVGRLEFLNGQSFARYLALHQRVDVNLDAFPYPGGTTTCHSLWMGVPVITLAGPTVISRGGASLLSVIGLSDLIARTTEEYVEIAVKLAGDPGRLKTLRAGLRERLAASPLMDAARFTRHLEAAYRQMWQRWCETAP